MSGPAETSDMATSSSFATATAAAMSISRSNRSSRSSSKNDDDDDDAVAVAIKDDDEINNSLQEPLLPLTATTAPITTLPSIASEVGGQPDLEAEVNDNDNDDDVIIIDESGWDHAVDQQQPQKSFRDWFWGFLFLLQFNVVLTISIIGIRNMIKQGSDWIPSNNDDNDDDDTGEGTIDRNMIWFLLSMIGSVITVASVVINVLLGALAPMLIQISLIVSPLMFLMTFVGSLVILNIPVALFSLVMSIVGIYYACHVWHRIPFATANLKIALSAIQDNHGLWLLAYLYTVKAYVWTFLWCCAVTELVIFSPSWVYDCTSTSTNSSSNNNNDDDDDVCHVSTRGKFIAIGMLLSFFWSGQVLKNILHTTIAGVVGTWWFDPEDARSDSSRGDGGSSGCFSFSCCGCSRAIYDSWYRSCVYSFGSICFGSLLVSVLQVVQFIVRCGRQQRDQRRQQRSIEATDFIFCLLQYLVDTLEYLLEYINTWAFVYVGLYGYDYWTAGKEVTTLFKARGWSVIINDHLVARSLLMMSSLIGLITGLVGVLLGLVFLGPLYALPAFFLGLILGGASCEILFGVVTSAVNTVVVCFAESPNQLRINHDPQLSHDLIQAWRKAYPQDCGF